MNSIERERIAEGWNLISKGARLLSLAFQTEQGKQPPPSPDELLEELAEDTGGTLQPISRTEQNIQTARHLAGEGWVCPKHGTSKVVPAGVSKRTGKKYQAFTVCAEPGCDNKPGRAA